VNEYNATYNATLSADMLGLAYSNYNFLMGLCGVVVGLFFAIGVIMIFVRR
jgi:hypothetical protein